MTQALPDVQPEVKPASGLPALLRRPILRTVLIGLAVIAVLVIVIWLIFQQMRASRGQPISYQIYPGATEVDRSSGVGDNLQTERVVYTSPAAVEDVYKFYQALHGEQRGESQTDQGCKLFPLVEDAAKRTPNDYQGRCLIDQSQDDLTQRLFIEITRDSTGTVTVIQVTRDWAR
jgi:hypothetical protein